ncbi:MAG: hypothetical protein A2451_08715 [Bdellovibrionales bacterium RIFOXYC2_FULL_39_8]|nr:MAG: hypothetical protein A2451_08715 [Bdellovibrionales bacterium RIFOXYC2_FULL_39_8]
MEIEFISPFIIDAISLASSSSCVYLSVEIHFFAKDDPEKFLQARPLKKQARGAWSILINPQALGVDSLLGHFYLYRVTSHGNTNYVFDPYAKSIHPIAARLATDKQRLVPKMAILNIESLLDEMGPLPSLANSDIMKNRNDFIAYELHVRDFTIAPTLSLDAKIKGTYLGVLEKLDHLKALGITHLQFMPLHICCTVDETNRSLQDEKIPSSLVNYNWGYDVFNFFVPSGWLTSDPFNPTIRIKELRQMTAAITAQKLGLILDVVFNHTYSFDYFEQLAPGCYIRREENGTISKTTGAGETIESRSLMARRMIIDSLKYYVANFGFNGFRFDLMSFLDHQTMLEIRQALGPDIILYGEGWDLTDLPAHLATTKTNLPAACDVGVFNDSARDSVAGSPTIQGFVHGGFATGAKVKSSIVGGIKDYPVDHNKDGLMDVFIDKNKQHAFANHPTDTINYLSIHDGHTLLDKINLSYKSEKHSKERVQKLALAILLTSQGKIVLEGGIEIGRTKPLAPNDPTSNRAHTSDRVIADDGATYFHENSYRSPDITNMFRWERSERFTNLRKYISGLISLRRKFSCFHFSSTQEIIDNLRFVSDYIPNSRYFDLSTSGRYNNWPEVPGLTIEFINGIPGKRSYMVGGIHPPDDATKNPTKNDFFVDFDASGRGQITFTKAHIEKFSIGSWGAVDDLKFKLVDTAGKWDYVSAHYSDYGSNTILPQSISKATNKATINLAFKDCVAGEENSEHPTFIAFVVNNIDYIDPIDKREGDAPSYSYQKFLVIHNASENKTNFKFPEILNYKVHDILVDDAEAGLVPLAKSHSVRIHPPHIIVDGKACAVIGLIA